MVCHFILLCLFAGYSAFSATPTKISWGNWDDKLFERARSEKKFVILDLEAVWCHWCHVMEEKTYSDPKVIELIQSKYIPIRVDQDSRPDLSNRYEDYGWPATIIFSPEGKELVKRSGYISPDAMASLLQAVIDDPTPGPSVVQEKKVEVSQSALLTDSARKSINDQIELAYDKKNGGWGTVHKYMQADLIEWEFVLASSGNRKSESKVKQTLNRATALLDPAWGGIYQYSVGGWNELHFEKIMLTQADNVRIYSLAYAAWKDKKFLNLAERTAQYLNSFLTSPDGAFYTSQDADLVQGEHSEAYFKLKDSARRAKGVPKVDKNIYARENGWAANALVHLAMATKKSIYLQQAKRSAEWILTHRSTEAGGFRHGEIDDGKLYLGDTLAMGQAFLSLFQATAEIKWLALAGKSLDFIEKNFVFTDPNGTAGGYVTAKTTETAMKRPLRDENIQLLRLANRYFHYTGEKKFRSMAESAMKLLASPAMLERPLNSGILLAEYELSNQPLHITVVAAKSDTKGNELFTEANHFPRFFKRVDWWDRTEGKLRNSEVEFPKLDRAAAFVCTDKRCSLPIFEAAKLREKIEQILQQKS